MNTSRKLLWMFIGLMLCIGLLVLAYYQDWPGLGGFVMMLLMPDLVLTGILWLNTPAGETDKEKNHA